MLGIGVGLRFPVPHAGGLPPALPSAQPLPITPAARWHPQFSQVGISNGRVVTATDLQGLAGLTASGDGPRAMTDGLGRSFWRFEGNQALEAANTLSMLVNSFAVFMVVRSHRCSIYNPFLDIGTPTQGNAVNALSGVTSTGSAANLRTLGNYPRDSTTPGSEHTVVGSQMQVIGVASRSAPLGNQALFHNGNRLDVGRAGSTNPRRGAMIGYAANANQGGNFDLYDIVFYNEMLTNGQCAEITAALQAGWSIPDVTSQLVLEGDSITQGTGPVTAALNCAMVLTEPGSNHIPANWRVTNYGTSGNTVANLVTRRDNADSWTNLLLPEQNVVAFEIGRNDMVGGGQTSAQHYANVVDYINTPATGLLQRGWKVRSMLNIAGAGNFPVEYRDLLKDPQYFLDTLTGSGQEYAGRLELVQTYLIEHNGERRFFDGEDAADTDYYAGDNTHPSVLGAAVRVTGGDTPQYGVAYGL